MIRFRKRIALARLAAVPLIVGVTFAVGSCGHTPWPASALNAGLFVLPVFIAGATLAQWFVFYLVAGILVGLMAPPVVTHGGPRTVSRPPASQPVVPPGPGTPPLRFRHASLTAYPSAVISLKDQETGMTFYVEIDGRRLIALDRNGAIAWGLDVFAEVKLTPAVGEPVIRHLRLDGNRLWVTCGQHDFVGIDVTTGEAKYAGAD